MTEVEQIWANRGRQTAIDSNGVDVLHDDGNLEKVFPAVFVKTYRETLLAIQLIQRHGYNKVFNA